MTDINQDDSPEETQDPIEPYEEPDLSYPQRHGCVTAWLVFILIANSIVSLMYLSTANKLMQTLKVSGTAMFILVLVGMLNVVCAIMLLKWKKIGFYGFAISSIAAFAVNIGIGLSPVSAILGLVGFGILYAILQITKDGVSAWDYLQ